MLSFATTVIIYFQSFGGGPFLLQPELALLVSYLFVVFKNYIIVSDFFFPVYFILGVGGSHQYNTEKQIKKLFGLPPSLSRVDYKTSFIFFLVSILVYLFFSCLF